MEVSKTEVKDCLVLRPIVHTDDRGHFAELFHLERHKLLGDWEWVQVNCSKSKKGVLRGLHVTPFAKLITCVRGAVLDVVADVREDSPTYKKHTSLYIDSPDLQIFVPPGCAHGFVALEDNTVVVYMQTGMYDPASESSVRWNDPALAIRWPQMDLIINAKDQGAPCLK